MNSMAKLTDQERIAHLEQRVAELEDTLLYVVQTLQLHGAFNDTEASVAQRMYQANRGLRPGSR
jgi:hypothetical protein